MPFSACVRLTACCFPPDNPVYSATSASVLAAAILFVLGVYVPGRNFSSPKPLFETASEDFRSFGVWPLPLRPSAIDWTGIPKLLRENRFAAATTLLCVRMEFFRQSTVNNECASSEYEVGGRRAIGNGRFNADRPHS